MASSLDVSGSFHLNQVVFDDDWEISRLLIDILGQTLGGKVTFTSKGADFLPSPASLTAETWNWYLKIIHF